MTLGPPWKVSLGSPGCITGWAEDDNFRKEGAINWAARPGPRTQNMSGP